MDKDLGASADADHATHEPNPQAVSALRVGIVSAEDIGRMMPDLPPSPFQGGKLDAETLAKIAELAAKATPPGISLCQHLKSIECDQACRCGYRGGVWAADGEHILFTMGEPVDDQFPGLEAPRIERAQEIYTAQLLVALYNYAPSLIAAAQAIEARSGETEGLDPKGESAVPKGCAQ